MARPRSDISERILHAARDRFLTEGVDGASLRQIAKDAGTSIGMVYYYFPTKDDLFLGVVEEKYVGMLEDFEDVLSASRPVEERIRGLFARMARMSDDEALVLRIIIREILVSNERRTRLADRFSRGHLPLILRLIADGTTGGFFRTDIPAPVIAISLLGIGLFPQLLRRLIGAAFPFAALLPEGQELAKHLAEVVLHGVKKRP